ncbi:MAG: DUF924 domain-containing protein, partial [Vicinamibacterales bacterium]|nr:DUF924 domain-containing protein [Vicinamibacterales bacterium]
MEEHTRLRRRDPRALRRPDRARHGALTAWTDSPDGALALIILCDQFTRNIYRQSIKAYCGDPTALVAARIAV